MVVTTDPGTVRRRRLELRLTRRQLARRCALDATFLDHFEAHQLPIYDHAVNVLSEQLGCDPLDLTGPRLAEEPDDVRRLGALLADADRPLNGQLIAAALGWTPRRVDAAAIDLRRRLAAVGQTVTRSPDNLIALAPIARLLTDHQRATLRQQELELHDRRVEALDIALHGRLLERNWDDVEAAVHIAAGELIAAGVLDEYRGRLEPSQRLRSILDAPHQDW